MPARPATSSRWSLRRSLATIIAVVIVLWLAVIAIVIAS